MDIFLMRAFDEPLYFFSVVILVVFSVCVHEFSHAWCALRNGDPTAARLGHLTLNPLRQMGVASLILLAFFGFCWGAVPVNPDNLQPPRKQAYVALAGPLANIGLFLIFALLAVAIGKYAQQPMIRDFMLLGAMLNMILFFINILPIPGLDGGNALGALVPRLRQWVFGGELGKGIFLGMLVLVFMSIDHIFALAHFCAGSVIRFLASIL